MRLRPSAVYGFARHATRRTWRGRWKWRERDSNPRWPEDHTSFQDWPYSPLRHPSGHVQGPRSLDTSRVTWNGLRKLNASVGSGRRSFQAVLRFEITNRDRLRTLDFGLRPLDSSQSG